MGKMMGVFQSILVKDDEIHGISDLSAAQIHSFVRVRLPLRIQVRGLFRFVPPTENGVEIFLFNEVDLPTLDRELCLSDLITEGTLDSREPLRHIRTQAILTRRLRRLANPEFDSLRTAIESNHGNGVGYLAQRDLRLFETVADNLLLAYSHLGVDQRLAVARCILADSQNSFLSWMDFAGVVVGPAGKSLDSLIGPQLFAPSLPPVGLFVDKNLNYENDLYPVPLKDEVLALLSSRYTDVMQFGYLRLAIKALRHAFNGDYLVAMLLACAACEGIVGRIVRDNLKATNVAGGEDLANRLLREAGMSLSIELLPQLFLKGRGPNAEMIKNALKAFQARNRVMHHIEKPTSSASSFLSTSHFSEPYGHAIKFYLALQELLHGY